MKADLKFNPKMKKILNLMYRLHLLCMPEDPLLVRVGRKVVGRGVVGCHVEEQVLVLRCRVLRSMRSWTIDNRVLYFLEKSFPPSLIFKNRFPKS